MGDDLRAVGDRIERLLAELAAEVPAPTFGRIEDVIAMVTQLYGAGLERIARRIGPEHLERLATDDLVASLLVLHDLHPDKALQAAVHQGTGEPQLVGTPVEFGPRRASRPG